VASVSHQEGVEPLPLGATIGILGGGQLARMLCMAAARLGHPTIVLEPNSPCPATQFATRQIVAAYDDPLGLQELGDACDVITYEFENVPEASAATLAARRPLRPNTRALAVSQDRLEEKRFLSSIGLTPAPFFPVDSQAAAEKAVADLGGAAILKSRRFGYDGKGQLRVDGEVPPDAFEQLGSVPLVAEAFVPFDCEISVIVARSIDGVTACFEPARNEHDSGILASSTVPSGRPESVVRRARAMAATLADELDYVGVLGLELFVLADGSLVANEFAPRVHNSGHWTEAACAIDQFEQHIRAITGRPLGDPAGAPCEMINLIGDDVDTVPDLLAEGSWRVHLYGKTEVRPGRKMGHATRLLRT
jgi:5-(carboxyamino)imidazole ribonucleotide synthase